MRCAAGLADGRAIDASCCGTRQSDHCTRHLARSTARGTRYPAPSTDITAAPSPNSICSNSSGWPTCRCHPTASRLRWRASAWTASATATTRRSGSCRPMDRRRRGRSPPASETPCRAGPPTDAPGVSARHRARRTGRPGPGLRARLVRRRGAAADEAERGRQRVQLGPDARWLAVTSAVVPTLPVRTRAVESRATCGSSPAPRSAPTAPAIATAPGAAACSSCPSRTAPRPRWAGRSPAPASPRPIRPSRPTEPRCISRPTRWKRRTSPRRRRWCSPLRCREASRGKSRALTDPSTPSCPRRTAARWHSRAIANDTPVRSYSQPDLFVLSTADGTVRNLTDGLRLRHRRRIVGRPARPARLDQLASRVDTGWIVAARSRGRQGRANIIRVRAGGRVDCAGDEGDQEVQSFSASRDGSRIASLVATPTNIGDVFVGTPGTGGSSVELKRITSVNDGPVRSARACRRPRSSGTQSFDGTQGAGLDPEAARSSIRDRKYPLILQIHGGPHAAYGYTFTHEFLGWRRRGYIVVYTQPAREHDLRHGLRQRHPVPLPRRRLQRPDGGVDDVSRAATSIRERLGVTGGSGGGLLTNWVIDADHRFAAAVSQRSIADWEASGTPPTSRCSRPRWFRKAAVAGSSRFAARSPITYVDQHHDAADADRRRRGLPHAAGRRRRADVPRAEVCARCPSVMVRFPGESHELSRSGRRGTASIACSTSSAGSTSGFRASRCQSMMRRDVARCVL